MGNVRENSVSGGILKDVAIVGGIGGIALLGGHVTGTTARVQDYFAEVMANPHSTLGVVVHPTQLEADRRKTATIVPVNDFTLPKVTE